MPEKDSAKPTFADDLHDLVFADPRQQALTRRAARILMSTVRPGCKIINHDRIVKNKLPCDTVVRDHNGREREKQPSTAGTARAKVMRKPAPGRAAD